MSEITVNFGSGVIEVDIAGGRGPIGPASGPLGNGSVTAETVSNNAGEQEDIREKIGAASSAVVDPFIASIGSDAGASEVGAQFGETVGGEIDRVRGAASSTTRLFFGDSITDGWVSNVYDPNNAWRVAVMNAMGWTSGNSYNGAVSGGSAVDWLPNLYLRTISADTITMIQPGFNDNAWIGDDPEMQESYKAGLLAAAAYAAIPDKIPDASITYSGTWSTNLLRPYGKYSATVGNSASFVAQGTAIYISTIQHTGNGGMLQVSVDGIDMGTWNLARTVPNGGAASALTYMPYLIRIGGLKPGKHSVVATVKTKAAGSASQNVYIEWVGSNASRGLSTSRVLIGSLLRANAAGAAAHPYHQYTETAHKTMNANHYDVVAQLSGDGLEVEIVPSGEVYNPDDPLQVGSDNIHPSSAALSTGGHYRIAHAFIQSLERYRRTGANTNGLLAGSWLPTIAGTTTPGTPTYSIQQGAYQVIGKRAFCDGRIGITAKGGMVDAVYITLPFVSTGAVIAIGAVGRIGGVTVPAGAYFLFGEVAPDTNRMFLRFAKTTGGIEVLPADVADTAEISFSVSIPV